MQHVVPLCSLYTLRYTPPAKWLLYILGEPLPVPPPHSLNSLATVAVQFALAVTGACEWAVPPKETEWMGAVFERRPNK